MFFKQKFPWGIVASAFVAGAVAGAAAALFLTPVTGKKFAKQFKNVVEDQVDNVEKLIKKAI